VLSLKDASELLRAACDEGRRQRQVGAGAETEAVIGRQQIRFGNADPETDHRPILIHADEEHLAGRIERGRLLAKQDLDRPDLLGRDSPLCPDHRQAPSDGGFADRMAVSQSVLAQGRCHGGPRMKRRPKP
jgi:hypothetical protein